MPILFRTSTITNTHVYLIVAHPLYGCQIVKIYTDRVMKSSITLFDSSEQPYMQTDRQTLQFL